MKPDINKIYYICSPYSTPVPDLSSLPKDLQDLTKRLLRKRRHDEAQRLASKLIEQGYLLVEPIASCHYKNDKLGLKAEYDYWQRRDRRLVERCDGVIVLGMDGWKESVGVTDEVKYAKELGREVWLYSPGSSGERVAIDALPPNRRRFTAESVQDIYERSDKAKWERL